MATQLEETLAQLSRSERSLRRLTLGGAIDRLVSAAFEAYGAIDGIEATGLVLPVRLDSAIRDAWKAAAALLTEAAMLDGCHAGLLDLESGSPAVSPLEQARNFYAFALEYGSLAAPFDRVEIKDGGEE